MATNTTKLALSKPDGTDLVDIAVLNGNFDKIDAASGATICTSTTRPASPWNGQVIFETDTLNALVYRTATSSWAILGGSTVASDPPAGAGNGNFWWDSDNGKLYIYYNDGNSGQWVSVMPSQTTVDVSENYIINGAFEINQRNFSSTTSSAVYGFDRWKFWTSGGTGTYSAQTFTLGSAPVSGYEGKNFARIVTSGQSGVNDETSLYQPIESVRTLADQTVTVSFWAKAGSGTPKIAIEMSQAFGSGGGSATVRTYFGQATLSTSWARYSVTGAIPSISGKTIGTANDDVLTMNLFVSAGSNLNSRTGSLGIQNNTFDIWGVQIEKGSIATSFKRAGGTLQGELAACQRYYYKLVGSGSSTIFYQGYMEASTMGAFTGTIHPTPMRAIPTLTFNSVSLYTSSGAKAYDTLTTVRTSNTTPSFTLNVPSTHTAGLAIILYASAGASSSVEWSAEL